MYVVIIHRQLQEHVHEPWHNCYTIITHIGHPGLKINHVKHVYRSFWLLWYNIYILGVFTEKPYSKQLECNLVYIPIITLSHATSHDFKWHQNKPWLSTIWLDVSDVMMSLTLFRCWQKNACKCFPASILALISDSGFIHFAHNPM